LVDFSHAPIAVHAAYFDHVASPCAIVSLFDHLPGVYFLAKDGEGRFVAGNAATLERLGAPEGTEFLGATDADFLPSQVAQDYRRDDELVMQSRQPLVNRLEAWQDAQGRLEWFLTTKIPILGRTGGVVGVAAVIRRYEERVSSLAVNEAAAVVAYLRENLSSIRQAADLAASVGVSERTLHRRIRAAFGITPHELILRVRIESAGEQLVRSNRPIAQIALDHGFCDQSAFTRHFRQRTGLTPRRFRERFRG
jgi:AraC-like DNA-binding protein